MTITFHKELANWYEKWYRDCCDYIIYCRDHGDIAEVEQITQRRDAYFTLLNEYWDDIQFYSIGDNAYLTPEDTDRARKEYAAQNLVTENKQMLILTDCSGTIVNTINVESRDPKECLDSIMTAVEKYGRLSIILARPLSVTTRPKIQ